MPTHSHLAGDPRAVRPLIRFGFSTWLIAALGACSSASEVTQPDPPVVPRDAAVASSDAGASSAPASADHTRTATDAGAAVIIEVPADASVCGAHLPFKPPGCACGGGEKAACWTGPADRRMVGKCRDGMQTCQATLEFGVWGPCEGEVLDCGEPPPPPPPKQECGCKPGAIVGCDEDCTAFVFCAPFSTKVCQPDGKWGPCRESLLPTLEDTNGCLNVFNGCLPGSLDGVFIGDCGKVFTCGHPPSAPPATMQPPAAVQ
jgi:hypothetical protein